MITAKRLKFVINAYYHTDINQLKDSRWFATHSQINEPGYSSGPPRETNVHTVNELTNALSMIGVYREKIVCAVIVENEHTISNGTSGAFVCEFLHEDEEFVRVLVKHESYDIGIAGPYCMPVEYIKEIEL